MQKLNVIIFLILIFTSCSFEKDEDKTVINDVIKNDISYNLSEPDKIYKLPAYLKEISGISYYGNNKMACVQDEHATIYIFNLKKGKVISKIDFGKNADYEDIAVVGNTAYVLRSDGTIFKVENFENKFKTTKIKTALKGKNNTEGLFFDKKPNSLLIACKDLPSINSDNLYENFKAIYSFNLAKEELNSQAKFLIDLTITDKLQNRGRVEEIYITIAEKLNLLKSNDSFHPSAIAIHPFSGNLYVISGVEKLLIIMSKTNNVLNIIELDKKIFNQPEGISFSENGDMYISNEGKKGKGNILKFNFRASNEK